MKEIISKLKFKEAGIVINAPPEIETQLVKLGFKTNFEKKPSINTLVFITSKQDFNAFIQHLLKKVESDSILWFAYPKGTSKIKTDINRDILRLAGEEYGITTVTAISIDDTWSALRFRPIDKVGK